MNRRWIVPGMFLLIAIAGCSRFSKKGPEQQEGKLFVSGRIDGDTVDISSKRDGKIVQILVREGDSVEAGQLLARIYSPQDESQVDAQRANVDAQRANVTEAERELEQAESAAPARVALAEANLATSQAELVRWQAEQQQAEIDAKRYPPLVQTGAVAAQLSEQQQTKVKVAQASTDASRKQVLAAEASLDQAKAQLQQIATAKANVASSQAQLTSSQAQLRRFEANVGDLQITAPIAGTILTRSAEPGRVIAAGQTILTLVDLHKLYLRGFIPEGDVGKVKVGQQAQVYLDSNPNEAVTAEVIRIDPQVMFTPENTYFQNDRVKQVMGVKLGLKGAFGFAKPGMPADGQIQVGNP
jgi:HlyD family secretion protein